MSVAETRKTAQAYFEAVSRRDPDGMAACWKPGGIDRLVGVEDLIAPHGVRRWFTELFAAFPDFTFTVLATSAEKDRCAVRWNATATFAGPGSFNGLEPNGTRLDIEGCDVVRVEDGLVVHNDAYLDGATMARQLGALPPAGSKQEVRLTGLVNQRTRLLSKLGPTGPEPVAEGVWVVRGGVPKREMNVYLIEEDGGGVCVFDAGIADMTAGVAAAGARLGGINRVVLGHAHADHRGTAPALGAPVYCHPAERADAEGDGGDHYFHIEKLERGYARFLMPKLLARWDGGPVRIAGTVSEGDDVAGFEVIDLPGHAPGLIGLWRAKDRLALVSDCFYTLDPQTGKRGHPRVPHRAFNESTETAQASMRKLAALEPTAAWAGHANPVTGDDVRAQLERAAATT
jgi:glyoxylase-like metal-dependent hydrolase (beta-lactamase superfamily II)/predicted ester cyclase